MAHILGSLQMMNTDEKAIHATFFQVFIVLSCKTESEKEKERQNSGHKLPSLEMISSKTSQHETLFLHG